MMMMDQMHLQEFLLRQQMMHAASLGGLQRGGLRALPAEAEAPACEARLLNAELWRSFHDLGTEMIITKGGRCLKRRRADKKLRRNQFPGDAQAAAWSTGDGGGTLYPDLSTSSAHKAASSFSHPSKKLKDVMLHMRRRMFPSLRVSLSGLEAREEYCVLLELAPAGRRRLRWAGGAWAAAGGAEPQSPRRVALHPDSPASGAHWTANPISFGKVKLTNNTMDTQGHMVLTSMHKYRPRVVVVRARDAAALAWGAPHAAFSFPETEFIAVTAYQNDRITKLKIDNNPFAKGFRACGQSKCKRKNAETGDSGGGGDSTGGGGDAKRACSDAASSCSDEGSLRSASPRTPPPQPPSPPSPPAASPPLVAYGELPYGGFPVPLGLWGAPCLLPPWPAWGRAPPPPPRALPAPAPAAPAARRVKSFTISSLLGES